MSTNSTQLAQHAAKFVGKHAAPCKRCAGGAHWVNKLGGIVCLTCDPPRPCDLDETNSHIEAYDESSGEKPANQINMTSAPRVVSILEISGLRWAAKNGICKNSQNNTENEREKELSDLPKVDESQNQIDTAKDRPDGPVNYPNSQDSLILRNADGTPRNAMPGELKLAISQLVHELAKVAVAAYLIELDWHALTGRRCLGLGGRR